MTFSVSTNRRSFTVEANHGAHARAMVDASLEAGESVRHICLYSQRTVEANPIMPANHARNVATGRRGEDGS